MTLVIGLLCDMIINLWKAPSFRVGQFTDIQPRGISTVYNYMCAENDKDLFSFPVEHRYHREILMNIGDPIGREIEYDDSVDPPYVRFVD